ncbi:MAG: asparagine synthase-related protein, partial [Terriglobia bacterium]
RLKARGHVFDPEGASYLVHAAEEESTFPAGLNGRFHGLLVDRTRGNATLFNDRYGLGRIYYHEAKDAFYFAAEAKAILAVLPELRRLDARGLGEFLSCGCIMENRTLFEGIHALPPAAAWAFRNGVIESKRAYFDPREWEEQEALDPEAWYRELREVFTRNLPRYFGGRERIGISLTGGLDSRMIMAWHRPPSGSLPCYTFGGSYRDCQDVKVARQVARVCAQPHEAIPVGRDFLSQFARYAERAVYLSDGCIEVNRAPALYCNERARAIAPARMTGNYGSEVLRPARAFKPVKPMPGLFHPDLMRQVDAAGETYARIIQTHPVSFSVFRQAPWFHYGLLALEQSQMTQRSPYLDNELMRTIFRAPQSALASGDACLRLVADGNPTLYRIRTDRGLGGNHSRAWAATRRNYLEFTFKAEYAYDYGMPQWVARIDHALAPLHLERLFLGRHKFYHFRVWYRNQLSDYLREMLLDSRSLSRPYLKRRALANIVESHVKGVRNYTNEIHKALTLELLHRLFLDPRQLNCSGEQRVTSKSLCSATFVL